MAARKKATKPAVEAPIEEVEDLEEDLLTEEADLTEDDELEVEEAPKAKKAKKAAPKNAPVEFGTKELAEHVNTECGTSYDAYALRILLRKLTKDGVIERTESEGHSRYSFTGPKDAQVKAIVKAVKEGATEKAKQERLDGLKEKRAAAKKPAATKASKAKAAKAKDVEPEVEDDEDFEDIEDI